MLLYKLFLPFKGFIRFLLFIVLSLFSSYSLTCFFVLDALYIKGLKCAVYHVFKVFFSKHTVLTSKQMNG